MPKRKWTKEFKIKVLELLCNLTDGINHLNQLTGTVPAADLAVQENDFRTFCENYEEKHIEEEKIRGKNGGYNPSRKGRKIRRQKTTRRKNGKTVGKKSAWWKVAQTLVVEKFSRTHEIRMEYKPVSQDCGIMVFEREGVG